MMFTCAMERNTFFLTYETICLFSEVFATVHHCPLKYNESKVSTSFSIKLFICTVIE